MPALTSLLHRTHAGHDDTRPLSEPSLTPAEPPRGRRPAQRRWVALALVALTGLLIASASLLLADGQRWPRLLLLAMIAGLWVVVVLVLQRLLRQVSEAAFSVRRFAQRLRRDDLGSAIDALRTDSSQGASILHEVAGEVEQVISERERRWKARVRLSGDWYWETDDQLRMTWLSEDLGSHRKLGLEPEELLGRTLQAVPYCMPPEQGWAAFNEGMHQRRSFRGVELEMRRPGRSSVWVALTGRARRDEAGCFIGYEGVGRDVTEQRLAYKRLADSERRYAVMAELSAEWYWESDAEHRLTEISPVLRELIGVEAAGRFVGRRRWEAYPDGASEEDWRAHRAELDDHRPIHNFEYLVRAPGRGGRWLAVNGRPCFDAKGRFLGYQGVGRDVTLRKRAEKMLLTRNAQLERLVTERTAELEQRNRDLDAFSRQLAHELRTPIGHLVGLSDLLRLRAWDRLAGDEREWLQLQGQSARAMSHTVTALLDLARSGSTPLVREPVDLSALARLVISELPQTGRRAPVDWRVADGLQADCSAPLARVMLMNLLGNAAKFTRDTEAPIVRFDAEAAGRFVVQDNGAGFDPQRAASLFQPFVRLHASEEFPGTGLGLSIVRRIVERHGGQIVASARPGAGASFVFGFLPAGGLGSQGETTDDGAARPA